LPLASFWRPNMIRIIPALFVALVNLILGAMPLQCIGNPISEHNMAGMAHVSGSLTPAVLGSVSFQTSCNPKVKEEFNRAVALLHSFWLDEAERAFKVVAIRDPDCAMAQWGVAMTDFNQVNGGPTPAGAAIANQLLPRQMRSSKRTHGRRLMFARCTLSLMVTQKTIFRPMPSDMPAPWLRLRQRIALFCTRFVVGCELCE
jgi:hypothetical protein